MQSFKSKELVTERFAWRHYYWCVLRPACVRSRAASVDSPCAGYLVVCSEAAPGVLRGVCLRAVAAACRFLTDEGIEYLREYLNLPSEIVPATLKKSTRPLERNTG